MQPTAEQERARAIFHKGESMVIEAGAGTGKTSTLELLGGSTSKRCQYLAFNKAIVTEAGSRMPSNVTCSTAHSLAYRSVVTPAIKARLNSSKRMRSQEIARHLGLDPITVTVGGMEKRPLAAGYLAGLVMRSISRFCQTADEAPNRTHVPYIDGIDMPTDDGRRTFGNNREVALHIEPAIRRAWEDLNSPRGALPFDHSHYLKMWQLSHPRINAEVIFFDEAQDANPVMAAVVAEQRHAQVVYVGDSQQAIYEWTGAVNALEGFETDARTFLTHSFRFGPEVAAVANLVLSSIAGSDLRLIGAGKASVVGPVAEPDAILCRTNAGAIDELLKAKARGQRPHIVGGGKELRAFAKAAQDLMEQGWTSHPELACFTSWDQVQDYVENDELGSELRLFVTLVDKYTVAVILEALDRMPAEAQADLIISTAHKAKGRQWGSVVLGGDFPTGKDKEGQPKPVEVSELRLLYVAVTRAQRELDVAGCGYLADLLGEAGGSAVAA